MQLSYFAFGALLTVLSLALNGQSCNTTTTSYAITLSGSSSSSSLGTHNSSTSFKTVGGSSTSFNTFGGSSTSAKNPASTRKFARAIEINEDDVVPGEDLTTL